MDERISTSNLASTETKNESLQNGGLSGSKQMPVWYRTPMKKPQSRSRKSVQHKSSAAQTTTSNEADKYLASVPEPARATLNSIRATIRSVVSPEATEGISYMVPAFKYKGLLIGFAALHTHGSLFVTDPSVMQLFTDELKPYDLSKGTIRFPADQPLPKLSPEKNSQSPHRPKRIQN
jgi:uncharacterized protein YdhG (YjbR/CyaY superfamily)